MKEILLITFASVNVLMSRFALLTLKQPTTALVWLIKAFTSAVSPLLLLLGLFVAISGFIFHSTATIIIGACSVILYFFHIVQITRGPDASTNLESCFGADWYKRIAAERKSLFLSRRYVFWLPKSPSPVFEQDIPFYIIPETGRALLCDMWQPPAGRDHSGLVFIYLHGSAWTMLDKDFGTRPLFRHLASQGHVIMDVAYRLFPETDFTGMVHDAKRAIAWMKVNAKTYGVNPERILIGGGSAGAHVGMLAAYTATGKQLTPPDLQQADLHVWGVISCYGQSDLAATYYHNCQHLISASPLSPKEKKPGGMPSWIRKRMGKDFHRLGFDKDAETGRLIPIIGGRPEDKPGAYALFSPISHVHKDCPATFILHGKQDILAPVKAIRELHARLKDAGVPVVMHLLPQTDHGFDLILTRLSPSAHNAIYDIERFMAIMAEGEPVAENRRTATNLSVAASQRATGEKMDLERESFK
ncbi:MAG TPA: alpha/beta hydrolase [Chryseosolibacter sp.]